MMRGLAVIFALPAMAFTAAAASASGSSSAQLTKAGWSCFLPFSTDDVNGDPKARINPARAKRRRCLGTHAEALAILSGLVGEGVSTRAIYWLAQLAACASLAHDRFVHAYRSKAVHPRLPARVVAATLMTVGLGLSVLGSAGAVPKLHHGSAVLRSSRAGSGSRAEGRMGRRPILVMLGSRVIDLGESTSVIIGGVAAHDVEVRLLGATDPAGLAYEWSPYRWRRLQLLLGVWRGVLPSPALPGIYQLQLRLDSGHKLLSSGRWLLRVFPVRTVVWGSSDTAVAAVRDFVAHLPGDQALVALRRWPQAKFDHRDPRLHRVFVIAFAPRADNRPGTRSGLFITTVRDGFHGRWRLLEATVQPYG